MKTGVIRRCLSHAIVAGVLIAAAGPAVAQGIDTVLVNGKILTVDAQSSIRSAVAIREGRIAAVGNDADIRRLAGPTTRTIDLAGTNRDSGTDRLPHARDARSPELQHRGELDRCGIARGCIASPARRFR